MTSFLIGYLFEIPILSATFLTFLISFCIFRNLTLFKNKQYLCIYIIILILQLILLFYQIEYKNLPLGGADWIHYDKFAQKLISESNNSLLNVLYLGDYDLFTRFTAVIYSIFGVNNKQMYLWVFLSSLITCRYIYLSSFEFINSIKSSQIIALLFMIWPIELIHSITFLREMPIQMFFIISIYNSIKYIKYNKERYFYYAILFSIIITLMHSGMIGVTISYLSIRFIFKENVKVSPIKLILLSIIIVIFLQSPLATPLLQKFGGVTNLQELVVRKQQYGSSGMDATTNYITSIPNNTGELVLQTPYLLTMFSLSPLPWQVSNLGTIIALIIEGIPRMIIVFSLIKYFIKYIPKSIKEKKLKYTFILIIVLTYLIFSMGTKSYGTAMRHRAKIFPLEIIIVYCTIIELNKLKYQKFFLKRRNC